MPSVPSGLPKRLRRSRSNPTQASASLQPYGSFRHKYTRSLSLICRVEVDNILTFGSNVSLRNGRVYPLLPPPRPPFSRRRLCICGGSIHITMTLPERSFCPRGVKTPSLFVAYFFCKNSNRFCRIYKMFIFSLVAHLKSTCANLVPRWHEVRRENKKDPYLHTRITGNTKKRTAHVRLKNVPRLCISTSLKLVLIRECQRIQCRFSG